MKNVDITVIIAVKKNYFMPSVFASDFPEGVNGNLKSTVDNIDAPRLGAVLLITDNSDLARSFVNRGLSNSYTVYIGDSLKLGKELENVTDVWSPFDVRGRHERRADIWAIKKLLPKEELCRACAEIDTDESEIADRFGVTVDFLRKAMWYYREETAV